MASRRIMRNVMIKLLSRNAVSGSPACCRSISRIRPQPLKPIKFKRRPPAPLVNVSVQPLIKETELLDKPERFNVYEPDLEETVVNQALQQEDFFQVRQSIKLKELFDAGVHFGHKEGCRNDYMKPYLFGCRQGVDIFDLDKTVPLLQDALNFLGHIVYRGGVVLFISRNKQNMYVIEKMAHDAGEYSHCRYWKGGLLTNSRSLYGSVTRLPDLCIFVNTLNSVFEEHAAVTECARMMIPTIGIVDSNCDPRLVTYPIPGNDDSPSAVTLYCKLFGDTIKRAKEFRKRDIAKENIVSQESQEPKGDGQETEKSAESV